MTPLNLPNPYAQCLTNFTPPHVHSDCAVVGSSDGLRILPMGQLIDRHRTVWRINNAPTVGFEAWVGHQTDVRLINHVSVDVWTKKIPSKVEGRGMHRGREFPIELCTHQRCLLVDTGKEHLLQMRKLRLERPNVTIKAVVGLRKAVSRCMPQRGSHSAGCLAVILAQRYCETPVHIYGFMPHCCDRRHAGAYKWPKMNYKYSHTNQTAGICCSSGREAMDIEFNHYVTMEHKGLVKMHPPGGIWRPIASRRKL